MKDGNWVLLESINLAPQSVLERILPIFEELPSLDIYEKEKGYRLWTPSETDQALQSNDTNETGSDGQPIHPAFRIFITSDVSRHGSVPLS